MNAWTQPGGPTRGAVALFIFVMAAFVLLGFRTEVNSHRIAMERWQYCQGGSLIIQRFNDQQQRLADVERTQTTNPELAAKRIKIYEDGVQPMPTCGERPEPWWRIG